MSRPVLAAMVTYFVVLVLSIVYLAVTWPSLYETYMYEACDGLRDAQAGINSGDQALVADGERRMSALDPASEQTQRDDAKVALLWDVDGVLMDSLYPSKKEAPTAQPLSTADLALIDRGVQACEDQTDSRLPPFRMLDPG
ncbi:MAG TPA: hypothetical protein VMT88_06495 [Actinomycetes bacterium]|nr:hypothetical protein [Actinomycetes bacterium]